MAPPSPQVPTPDDGPSEDRADLPAPNRPGFTEAVLETLPGLIFVVDADDGLVWWNQHLEEATGYSAQALRGMAPSTLFADADARTVRRVLETVRTESDSLTADVTLVAKPGTTVPCELTGKRLPNEARRTNSVVGIGREISLAEAQEQDLRRERDRLAALRGQNRAISAHLERGGA